MSSGSNLGDAFDDRSIRATSASSDYDDGSHYRRMKREERREMERRQRAECSLSPESTRSPSAVPELVSSHSRNTSTASSTFSFASSSGSLSRHPSTSSHTPFTASVVIDDAIMEDDDELSEAPTARSTLRAQARRQLAPKELAPSSLGPGKKHMEVNDMLDEIINMEESFRVPDDPSEHLRHRRCPSTPERDHHFVPTAFRPPRTPSPVLGRRASIIPPAPNAPDRRNSLVQQRPPSMYAHQSSLSESHTALYLATASPVAPPHKPRHRRSASPKLSVRRSLTFTPQAAGPALYPPRSRYDSPGLTPVRRKHLTPTAHHPPMEGWRFPTASMNVTPTNARYNAPVEQAPSDASGSDAVPQLLWPQARHVNQSEPAAQMLERSVSHESPSFEPRYSPDDELFQPPSSALRLGMLMNSEDDVDSDDGSTVRGSVRGSIRQSLTAPIPPFARAGW